MQEVQVFRGPDAPGVREMIGAALHDEGIECVIKGSGMIAGYPMSSGPMGEMSVWVLPENAERATEVIEALTSAPVEGAIETDEGEDPRPEA